MPKLYKYSKYKKQMKKHGAKTVATRKEFSLVQTRMETAALKKKHRMTREAAIYSLAQRTMARRNRRY